MRIPVKVFLASGETKRTLLYYTPDGPVLMDMEKSYNDESFRGVEFSIVDEEICQSASLSIDDRVDYNSSMSTIKYSLRPRRQYEPYPPSSRQWISHLSSDGFDAIATLHRIKNGSKYLLSIIDASTNELLRLQTIYEFEASMLKMKSDWSLYNDLLVAREPESMEKSIDELLSSPAPPLSEITTLLEGVNIPNFKRYESVRDTFDQLVPRVYPKKFRDQIMAFLAWTIKAGVPTEDPLDFLENVYHKYQSSAVITHLIFGHTQCLIQGIQPPRYVRIMAFAHQGSSKRDLGPTSEEAELAPWETIWFRIMEMFPDRKGRIIEIAHSLNVRQEVHTEIPITRKEAGKSKEAWLDRFSLIRSNLITRGYIQDSRLGLIKLVYIGRAHRWPHKHLQFSARLGSPNQKPPYIQVILMPKVAVDRVMRTKQNFIPIDWTASRLNYGLYQPRSENWKYNIAHFENSLLGRRTRKQVNREFSLDNVAEIHRLNQEDARVLDLVSWGTYNQSLELGEYNSILRMSSSNFDEKIESFVRKGIIQLQYLPTIYGLASICLEIRNEVPQLYSIARSSLHLFPSATTMVSESRKTSIIMARVPEERVYDILVNLPAKAFEHDIQMKGYRVDAFAGYVNNLYQRLLLPDGSWDDDISGLLSQMRS